MRLINNNVKKKMCKTAVKNSKILAIHIFWFYHLVYGFILLLFFLRSYTTLILIDFGVNEHINATKCRQRKVFMQMFGTILECNLLRNAFTILTEQFQFVWFKRFSKIVCSYGNHLKLLYGRYCAA